MGSGGYFEKGGDGTQLEVLNHVVAGCVRMFGSFFAAYFLNVLFIYHSHPFQLICHALTVETFDLFCLIYTVRGFKALRVASAL